MKYLIFLLLIGCSTTKLHSIEKFIVIDKVKEGQCELLVVRNSTTEILVLDCERRFQIKDTITIEIY